MRILVLVLASCAKKPPPVPVAEEVPDDVPTPRTDGPLAGPRAVVDEAPPMPPPEGTPGGGLLPPYLTKLRKALVDPLDACLAEGPATVVGTPALVVARLDAEGRLLSVGFERPSGVAWYDACLAKAFEAAVFPAPPPEVLGPDGQLQTPQMAFR